MIDLNFITRFKPLKGRQRKLFKHARASYLKRVRFSVAMFYCAMGLTFASWASRIPDIKTALQLSEGELGTLLFALPFGQLMIMPFSGKLVTKFSSYQVLLISLFFYAFSLTNLGLAQNSWQLAIGLFFFGLSGNLCNIAVNTQGVYTEALFKKTIMGTFHGTWSFAGFSGALIGLGMMAFELSPYYHFLIVGAIVIVLMVFNYRYLIRVKDKIKPQSKKLFSKPDTALIWLGIIAFCCMASEGVMFDWSGVYFKEVVQAPKSLVAVGYASFMIMMASGRFLGDGMTRKFGKKKVMQISGILISTGLFVAVLFPYVIPCTLAFMVVGIGVSTIVPTVYSLAGKNPNVPPGEALTIVSSVGFLGFLMGPPVIGYIAAVFGLQVSFAFIGIFGFLIALMISRIKAVSDITSS